MKKDINILRLLDSQKQLRNNIKPMDEIHCGSDDVPTIREILNKNHIKYTCVGPNQLEIFTITVTAI